MALGTLYVTVPAFAAAIGIYYFDRNHSKPKHLEAGYQAYMEKLVAVAKSKEGMKNTQMPKVALEFDGLHCFETLVVH
ncbi:hypothetical protein HHK36_016283 [Tetracentron sinense]|uniref:Uncharacterized protein n=1 Tax=Tetracentron sinense TaxID=13715 RepID=A0A834YZE0_TETSI|nr:hypothetical protein HHK36_032903 [Tetracentron sinense]KAF8397370.1 hypothetical protein HHK36_016283 [Tetracentron sinense]